MLLRNNSKRFFRLAIEDPAATGGECARLIGSKTKAYEVPQNNKAAGFTSITIDNVSYGFMVKTSNSSAPAEASSPYS